MNIEDFSNFPVHFNHLYVVLDDKTYRAIQGSDFSRSAFPGKELRSTVTATGERWSGTYFYCQDTYLEFFGISTGRHWRTTAQVGWSGLAFSIDQSGGVDYIRKKINKDFNYDPFYELRQLNTVDGLTNWFSYARIAEMVGLDSFDSWVMEYHPDIFRLKGIEVPAKGGLTRRAYLSPWNQADSGSPRQGNKQYNPLFSRVTGATLVMEEKQALIYSSVLQSIGYSLKEETGQLILSSNRFSLIIKIRSDTAVTPGYRITGICLEMIRPSIAPSVFVFAPGSRLILNNNLTANWYFEE